MKRRSFLAVASVVATTGCVGSDEKKPLQEVENIPESAETVKPLAVEFHATVTEYYQDVRVFINTDSEIVMEYRTQKESSTELETELFQIATLYVEIAESHQPATLSIVTSQIQAIVPEPSVSAYIEGELEEDAFIQTIEVTDVTRTDE